MERLFMQLFERGDWLGEQVRQQADSFAQTLACSLFAAGHRPPDWLLPSSCAGGPQELNGKSIVPELVFTGSRITAPAANRTVFLPPAAPNTLFRKSEIPNGYSRRDTNFAALDTDQHEEPQQEQTSLSQELAETCAEANMFSRIQRSKSRQRFIEDRLHARDDAAKSGSCDGVQVGVHKSELVYVGSDKTTASSSSIPCVDVVNITETTYSCSGQENVLYASQGRSNDLMKRNSDVGNQRVRLDPSLSLGLESKIAYADSDAEVGNHCAIRDLPNIPPPVPCGLNVADSVCHIVPEIHPLVEPKKLQFDGGESVCMDTACEQTEQQQGSAMESNYLDLNGRNPLSGDPYTTNYSQEPHSIGKLMLDGFQSEPLKPVNALVKHHEYALEHDHPNLTGTRSTNEAPSLTCAAEVLSFLCDPSLQKDTQYVTEANSLGRPCSKVSHPLEMGILDSDEMNYSERSCPEVNLLLEKDILQTGEETEELPSSYSLVSPPPFSGHLEPPTQLADERLEANASPGTPPKASTAEQPSGRSDHLSNLLRKGTNNQCSQGMSAGSPEQLPPQNSISGNGKYSNGCAAIDAFESAENESRQDQYLLARPSLKFNGSTASADAPLGHPSVGTQNKMHKGNPASDLVNYHPGKSGDDFQVHKAYDGSVDDKKNESVAPEVMSSISSGRTREMCEIERNCVASSEKCNGGLLQEEENPPVENALPVNASACKAENVKKGKSSRPSVQYLLRSLVSCEKNSQPKAEIGNAQKRSRADAENFSGRSRPSGRYLLRSSGFCEFMSLESETKNAATNSNMSVASDAQEIGDSSPKLRNNASLSNVALCKSSSGNALSPTFNSDNCSRCSIEGTDLQKAQLQNHSDIATTSASPSCSRISPDNEECCTYEENYCFEGQGLSVAISSVEQQKTNLQMDELSSQSVILNPEMFSGTSSLTMLLSYTLDPHGKRASDPIASIHEKLNYGSGVELDTKLKSEDPTGFLLSGATIPRQKGDEFVDCNDKTPEFQCFDVSVPLTFETLSDISNKISTVIGMHQRVATMSGKATNYSFHGDVSQYSAGDDDGMMDSLGSCGLGISGSFSTSDVVASCSNASEKQENGKNPLTPAAEKYSLGTLSARFGSISEHMDSIPELSCFGIDEDNGTAEKNKYQDILPESVGNKWQSGREALKDITVLCQNTELGFMDTGTTDLTTETCSSELNHHSDRTSDCDNNKSKENSSSLVKREGKVSHSLHNRLSKTDVIDNKIQRNTSEANLGKWSKPSNIVANVASFIPLVKPKVPPTTACVKKDVRVKALEAAEAAKHLEEKKRNEREMRKAAAKLEREKLKQEKDLKQRQEQEQKKKRDTDMATRKRSSGGFPCCLHPLKKTGKRQRDEEEKWEKERKRKCAEEARKQQKQPMERRRANDVKDAHSKASNDKELRKILAEAVKSQGKPYETTDLGNKAVKSNNEKVMIVDERPSNSGSLVKENIQNNPEEAYMMSPYKDSDEEDEEHEEQSRQRRKLFPSWAEKGNLDKILLSNRALGSTEIMEIFTRKFSFNLNDVLPAHVLRHGFN